GPRRRGRGQRPQQPVPPGREPAHRGGRLRELGRPVGQVLRRAERAHRQDHRRVRPRLVTDLLATNPARPVLRRRAGRVGGLTAASGLGLGVAMLWFSLLVLIPLAAVIYTAADGGWDSF